MIKTVGVYCPTCAYMVDKGRWIDPQPYGSSMGLEFLGCLHLTLVFQPNSIVEGEPKMYGGYDDQR